MAVKAGAVQRAEPAALPAPGWAAKRSLLRDLTQIRRITAPGSQRSSERSNPVTALFCCLFLTPAGTRGAQSTHRFQLLSRLGKPSLSPGREPSSSAWNVARVLSLCQVSRSWLRLQLLCLKFSMPLGRLFLVLILNREGLEQCEVSLQKVFADALSVSRNHGRR